MEKASTRLIDALNGMGLQRRKRGFVRPRFKKMKRRVDRAGRSGIIGAATGRVRHGFGHSTLVFGSSTIAAALPDDGESANDLPDTPCGNSGRRVHHNS
ncbi:hypothetical protein [Burkholderia ubonensis]|uniref:hypothetical protein n=1 Tax=Burkholderia ubonensis TaxID=101571 RepID=UPI001054AA08|nr:hypothetical protein [Burkholderia ubonensis]